VSLAIYLAAIAVAFYRPWLSLVIVALVTVVWVVPDAGVRERPEVARSENAPIE
jgi:hypothetical protein